MRAAPKPTIRPILFDDHHDGVAQFCWLELRPLIVQVPLQLM